MKVFIADSSALLCQRLVGLLSELPGVESVGYAQDASDALRAVRDLTPDVVILDLHLVGSSGLDLLKTIKREERVSFVMVLTNDVSRLYRKKCFDAGADFLLHKAVDLKKAKAILQSLLPRFKARVTEPPPDALEGR